MPLAQPLEWLRQHVRAALKNGRRRDWLLDHVASPVAPLTWLRGMQPRSRLAHWGLRIGKGLVLTVWAVGFIWLWFICFWVVLFWETFSSEA